MGLPLPLPAGRVRGLLDGAVAGTTERLAQVVAGVPEPHLRRAMRTPLRRVALDVIFWGLPRALESTPAADVTTSIRCHVTGRPDGAFDVYWVEFSDGRWTTRRGEQDGEPELTITIDAAELLRLAAGTSSPIQAYLAGRLRASGSPAMAARLTLLFRSFGPRRRTPAPSS